MECRIQEGTLPPVVSAVSQNQPVMVEIKGLKTSHFSEYKTAPWNRRGAVEMGDVECPESEPTRINPESNGAEMVAAAHCARA